MYGSSARQGRVRVIGTLHASAVIILAVIVIAREWITRRLSTVVLYYLRGRRTSRIRRNTTDFFLTPRPVPQWSVPEIKSSGFTATFNSVKKLSAQMDNAMQENYTHLIG